LDLLPSLLDDDLDHLRAEKIDVVSSCQGVHELKTTLVVSHVKVRNVEHASGKFFGFEELVLLNSVEQLFDHFFTVRPGRHVGDCHFLRWRNFVLLRQVQLVFLPLNWVVVSVFLQARVKEFGKTSVVASYADWNCELKLATITEDGVVLDHGEKLLDEVLVVVLVLQSEVDRSVAVLITNDWQVLPHISKLRPLLFWHREQGTW